mmetsp:Transcript_9729/g.23482  ORF Transcript_9729/g.23482 Transcript_9729/m.23482 type:complete len:226 (+) Transcript_9729:2444-3121(+)
MRRQCCEASGCRSDCRNIRFQVARRSSLDRAQLDGRERHLVLGMLQRGQSVRACRKVRVVDDWSDLDIVKTRRRTLNLPTHGHLYLADVVADTKCLEGTYRRASGHVADGGAARHCVPLLRTGSTTLLLLLLILLNLLSPCPTEGVAGSLTNTNLLCGSLSCRLEEGRGDLGHRKHSLAEPNLVRLAVSVKVNRIVVRLERTEALRRGLHHHCDTEASFAPTRRH